MATKRIAIVTGASAGLGMEFARQAAAGYGLDEIWLVARRKDALEKLAQELSSRGKLRAVVLPLDLQKKADIEALAERLRAENPQLALLVNNAGYGKAGKFSELPLDPQLGEIELNVSALTALTHIALPFMVGGSHLLQVASSIGFSPAPQMAVYAATKAYVVSLSYALREELREREIEVCAVCPGPVATEFLDVAYAGGQAKTSTLQKSWARRAPDVVRLAYRDIAAGRGISVYGLEIRAFVFLTRFFPHSWLAWMVARRL